jgi:two-component sensor histidine kinase
MNDRVTIQGPCRSERLLLNELMHRMNNELAIAIGMLSLAALRTKVRDARDALVRVESCLKNFARVNQALQIPHTRTLVDGGAYLLRLCQAISLSRLEPLGIELAFVERPLSLDSEQCWRLGMIVSELITNAVNHAFRKGPGRIRVEALCADSAIRCRVEDNGTGALPIQRGRGLDIIEALLQELSGHLDQHFSVNGSVSTILFPVRPLTQGFAAHEANETL